MATCGVQRAEQGEQKQQCRLAVTLCSWPAQAQWRWQPAALGGGQDARPAQPRVLARLLLIGCSSCNTVKLSCARKKRLAQPKLYTQ